MIKVEKISFKTLKKLSARDRINAINDPRLGPTLLNALSPTDIAMLFPRYYLEGQPDISGFIKAIPSSTMRARQEAYDQVIQQTPSGTTRPIAGKPGGWLEKFREKMTTTVVKKPVLTSEQEDVINKIKSGQLSADDPKADFLKKIPPDKLKEFNIEQTTDEKGNKVYKSIPVTITKEEVERRIKEDASEVGKHAALKALIAKKEHGLEGDAAYDTVYNFGKGVMNPPKPIHEMTVAEILAYQKEAKSKAGSAAFPVGKYQFTETTLRELTKNNKLDPNTTFLTKELQEKYANQLIEKRGSNPANLMEEWDALKRFSNKNEITAAMEIDKNAPAIDPKLSDKEKFDKMLDTMRHETDVKIKDSMAEYLEKIKPSTLTDPSGGKLSVVGRASQVGAGDPRLQSILNDASKYLPEGYSVQLYSGYRPGDPRFHGKGMAADIRIVDPQGKVISNYQDPKNFRLYEEFAQAARKVQHEKHPDLEGAFRWGGYFSGGAGKYGAMDLMHFDLGGHKVGMAGGSWEKGLTEQQRSIWGGAPVSHGMGEVTKFKLPESASAKAKISEATPEQEKQLREDFYRSEKNPFAKKPASELSTETRPPGAEATDKKAVSTEPAKTEAPKVEAKPTETVKQEAPKVEPTKTEAPKETPIQAKPVQSVAVKADGGKVDLQGETKLEAKPIESLKGDNTVVVDQNDTPKFTMNTEKEAAVYDPLQRNVDIIPSQRIDVGGLDKSIQQASQPNITDEFNALAENLKKEFTMMISDQDKQKPRPVTNTITDRDPNMIEKLGVVSPTPSASRAFSRSRFVETGDAKDDFHHSLGTSSFS